MVIGMKNGKKFLTFTIAAFVLLLAFGLVACAGKTKEQRGYIIIGDSHAVVAESFGYQKLGSALEDVVYQKNLFFVHTGTDPAMGTYDWLAGEGTEKIGEVMQMHTEITDWVIISIHGTSMCVTPDIDKQYTQLYTEWMEQIFPKAEIYLVSVPPLDEERWLTDYPQMPPRFNADIKKYNEKMKEAFPEHYMDMYDWFLENGTFIDAIHYDGEVYRNMFDTVISEINSNLK